MELGNEMTDFLSEDDEGNATSAGISCAYSRPPTHAIYINKLTRNHLGHP